MVDSQQQFQEEAERLLKAIEPADWRPDHDWRDDGADQVLDSADDRTVCFLATGMDPGLHESRTKFIAAAPRLVRQLLALLSGQVQAVTALESAHGAILDAIGLEDGLDGAAGLRVLQMIRAALLANGREPAPIPREDEEVPITPAATASIEPSGVRVSDGQAPGLCTTSGEPVEEVRAAQTNETGQHAAYIVLCPTERAKGFVRPYRDAYRHVGPAVADPGNRLVNSGAHPELLIEVAPKDPSDLDAPAERVVRYWSRDQLAAAGKRCGGTVTTMGRALSETYARNPKFYGATFCVTCNRHFPVSEFVWTADGERVGS